MPTHRGPCQRCGRDIHKYVRPGKEALCLDCGLAKAAEQHRANSTGRGEEYSAKLRLGALQREQYQRKGGEWFERWREGMQRYVNASLTTDPPKPDTVTPDKPPRKKRPTGRT